jgi:hypothetical protein
MAALSEDESGSVVTLPSGDIAPLEIVRATPCYAQILDGLDEGDEVLLGRAAAAVTPDPG